LISLVLQLRFLEWLSTLGVTLPMAYLGHGLMAAPPDRPLHNEAQ
jgi:hypothetical protein